MTRRPRESPDRLDFDAINRAALAVLPTLLRRWLPDGRVDGSEFIALNPRRPDRRSRLVFDQSADRPLGRFRNR